MNQAQRLSRVSRWLAFRAKTLAWVAILPAIAVLCWRAENWRLHPLGFVLGLFGLVLLYGLWRTRSYEKTLLVTVTPEAVFHHASGARDRRIAREDALGFTVGVGGLTIRTAIPPRIGPQIFVPREIEGYEDLQDELSRIGLARLPEIDWVPTGVLTILFFSGMGLTLLGATAWWVNSGFLVQLLAIGWQTHAGRGKPGQTMTSVWGTLPLLNLPLLFRVNHVPRTVAECVWAILFCYWLYEWWQRRQKRTRAVA